MKHMILPALLALLALAACDNKQAAKDAAQPAVTVRHVEDKADYPRLTGLADKTAMDKVNALLAGLEEAERQERAACLKEATADGGKPAPDYYYKTLDVSYLSPRFLSLHGAVESDCAVGSAGSKVLRAVFDLGRGERVNWETALKPGVASDPAVLMGLYRAAWRRLPARNPECLAILDTLEPTALPIWLSGDGLMLEPEFGNEHVACADAVAISAREMEPHLASAELMAELRNPAPQPAVQAAAPAANIQPAMDVMTIKDKPAYPRLTRLADKAAMERVNGVLAEWEARERQERKECSHYEKSLDVTWLSPRFLGLKIMTNSDCGGAHPNIETVSHTFDLVEGREISLPRRLGHKAGAGFGSVEGLRTLYKAAYARQKERAGDKDCLDEMNSLGGHEMIVWLDRAAGGLGMEPGFPFVIQACADALSFGARDVAPYVGNKALLEEMQKR